MMEFVCKKYLFIIGITLFVVNNTEAFMNASSANTPVSGWSVFLQCWEKETLHQLAQQEKFYTPEEELIYRKQSQHFESATKEQIAETEKRLNIKLPKSYIDFLTISNGWIVLGMDAYDGYLLPIDKIGFFKVMYPKVYSEEMKYTEHVPDNKYFVYGKKQDVISYRREYLSDVIVISSFTDSAIYLLNPSVVNEDGEWEAWFLSYGLPGVLRFPSFAHLMRYAAYKSTKQPEYDYIYEDELLENSCAKYLKDK